MTPAGRAGNRRLTGRVLAETSDLADLWPGLRPRELLDSSGDLDPMEE
ncbi:hypothetical protein AB0D35_01015 [Streptomyces sp. NPDC048301]